MYSNSIPQIITFPSTGLPVSSLACAFPLLNGNAPSSYGFLPRISEFENQNTAYPPRSMLVDWTRTNPYFPQMTMRPYISPHFRFPGNLFQRAPQIIPPENGRRESGDQEGQTPEELRSRAPLLKSEASRNKKQSLSGIGDSTKLVTKSRESSVPVSDMSGMISEGKRKCHTSSESYLGDIQKSKATPIYGEGKIHQWRNVSKCILRQMTHLVLEEKARTQELLLSSGYSEENIKIAFRTILYYGGKEVKKGTKKVSQKVLNKIIEKRSVFAEILREALLCLLNKWNCGEFGKMYVKNLSVYKEVCLRYLEEVNKTLSKTPQPEVPLS